MGALPPPPRVFYQLWLPCVVPLSFQTGSLRGLIRDEILTSCRNTPNLHDQGFADLVSLVSAEPGETVDGWIRYEIEDSRKSSAVPVCL